MTLVNERMATRHIATVADVDVYISEDALRCDVASFLAAPPRVDGFTLINGLARE